MTGTKVYYGNNELVCKDKHVKGEYVIIDNEKYYKISNYDEMTPFFMSIVSNSDHWMFISSTGGLTSGRKNPDHALFPYYTDDKIHYSHETTGNKTIIRIHQDDKIIVWKPFSKILANIYNIERNIYKNITCNKIIFEEVNLDLDLKFSYSWLNTEKYGFVKKSKLLNLSNKVRALNVLDGVQNIMPYGLYQQFQNEYSTLADGYKRNELLKESGIGLFSLTSIPSDKAEPSESLRTTVVWSLGVDVEKYLLSSQQLSSFALGKEIISESEIKAQRGAYFVNSNLELTKEGKKEWLIVADINQDLNNISKIENLLKNKSKAYDLILEDVEEGTNKLNKIVATVDGLQIGKDDLITSRHYANVLFNTMRGGIFDNAYIIEKSDLIEFIETNNPSLVKEQKNFLNSLNESISYFELLEKVNVIEDAELKRLTLEYLPLTFSRRHGDPSRPWNRFSIDIKNHKNEKVLNYQGNWRDLFQNWEALSLSYPEYLSGMITKFLNGSTADGYNPYRVTRDGFDWEIPELDMPWANIGYWGDHQIIYLLKLLEQLNKFSPSSIIDNLSEEIFTYANVPYIIKNYEDILKEPQNTISFDYEKQKEIENNEEKLGTNAKYLHDVNKNLIRVNLTEKILVPLLSKLSNFIPGAGIWMNTQRPEWNDANNALVGNGASMVTLYYMKRYVEFCIVLFSDVQSSRIELTEEVSEFLHSLIEIFEKNKSILGSSNGVSDSQRKIILDGLGISGEKYRNKVYAGKLSNQKEEVGYKFIIDFLFLVNKYIDQTIVENKREDGLYHSYNLVTIKENEIEITNLYEMLEGQVAVLSSGFLSYTEVVNVVDALKRSSLYREDQNSYILYPNRNLPEFFNKNNIECASVESSELLTKLIQNNNNDIITKDSNGNYHFNGDIKNAKILEEKLLHLNLDYELSLDEKSNILEIYENHFNHNAFTGRSGTFYKYEGLGSIYWHMVSKLLLAVQENYYWAIEQGVTDLKKLKDHYYEIKEGIGVHKSPKDYGAFPTDPYSHTPIFSGAQQPGMTGQVKEDIISRFGELGITIKYGKIIINTSLIKSQELIEDNKRFKYYDVYGNENTLNLEKDSLVFTFCQVPFVYIKSNKNKISVYKSNDTVSKSDILELNIELSKTIFKREGIVRKVLVEINF